MIKNSHFSIPYAIQHQNVGKNQKRINIQPHHSFISKISTLVYNLFKSLTHLAQLTLCQISATINELKWKIFVVIAPFFFSQNNRELARYLVINNYREALEKILARGVDPNSVNNAGHTLLMIASFFGHKEIVHLLLDKGADPNLLCQDNENSALHYAANQKQKEVIQILLTRGADSTLLNKDGFTPALHAYKCGYYSIGDVLNGQDSFHQTWLFHHMMSLRFACSIKIQDQGRTISLNGANPPITYPILLDSINRLRNWQSQGPADWKDSDTEEVLKIIEQASLFISKETVSLEEKIRLACEKYAKKETFILPIEPSPRHINTIIFTPDYVIRGERGGKGYMKTHPITPLKPGLLIHTVANPTNVSNVIKKLLTNNATPLEDGVVFVYQKIEEELKLSSPFYCAHADQRGPVCSWTSAKLAFRGAIISQLIKKGYSLQDAETYSKKMYKFWVEEDRLTAIQDYIDQVDDNHKTYILACIYKLQTLKKNRKGMASNPILDLIENQADDAVRLSAKVTIEEDRSPLTGKLFLHNITCCLQANASVKKKP